MSHSEKKFIIHEENVFPVMLPKGLVQDAIPSAIYTVKANNGQYYLAKTFDKFDEPDSLYGSIVARTNQILTTYEYDSKSLGALFTGYKGAGKTAAMKHIANTAMDRYEIPVLLIQDPFNDSAFFQFIDSIGECVMIFDEFGKIYKTDTHESENLQHKLLTFFSGTNEGKRLILLAENKEYDIDNLFLNRPSRILFHYRYKRLEEEVVDGYCQDNLHNLDLLPGIKTTYYQSNEFTFDNLQALVRQCNIFKDQEYVDIVDGLNIDIKTSTNFIVSEFLIDGEDRSMDLIEVMERDENSIYVNYRLKNPNYDPTDEDDVEYYNQSEVIRFKQRVKDTALYESAPNRNEKIVLRTETKIVYSPLAA